MGCRICCPQPCCTLVVFLVECPDNIKYVLKRELNLLLTNLDSCWLEDLFGFALQTDSWLCILQIACLLPYVCTISGASLAGGLFTVRGPLTQQGEVQPWAVETCLNISALEQLSIIVLENDLKADRSKALNQTLMSPSGQIVLPGLEDTSACFVATRCEECWVQESCHGLVTAVTMGTVWDLNFINSTQAYVTECILRIWVTSRKRLWANEERWSWIVIRPLIHVCGQQLNSQEFILRTVQ